MQVELADLCKQMTQGVYVIGVRAGELQNAFTAAWVMQVSFDPCLLAISINPEHYSYQLLQQGGICSVNVLARQQMQIAEHFGTPGVKDKMAKYSWQQASSGAPFLPEALAYFDCEVSHYAAAGDHQIAVCKVLDGAILKTGTAMLYSDTEDMDGSREIYQDAP